MPGKEARIAYLAVDKWSGITLCITVSGSNGSSSLVQLALSTILLHLREVKRSVHAARELRALNIKGELLASELHHLILVLTFVQKVNPWSDNLSSLIQHGEAHGISLGIDTISGVIRDAFDNAIFRASLLIRADGGIWLVAPGAAVELWMILLMNWVGKGVEDNRRLLLLAAVLEGAFVGIKLWVHLLGLAQGLSRGECKQGGDEEGSEACHF